MSACSRRARDGARKQFAVPPATDAQMGARTPALAKPFPYVPVAVKHRANEMVLLSERLCRSNGPAGAGGE
jgi:hypothetical protein